MPLFRQEAVEAQRRQLFGAVALHQPVAFPVLTAAMAAFCIISFGYVATASFVRKETVHGTIVPAAGLADVPVLRSGTLVSLGVELGQDVKRGAPLAAISTDVAGARGELSALQENQMRLRLSELDVQLAEQASQATSERGRLTARAAAALREVERLRSSLGFQEEQLALAERQLRSIGPLVTEGYISTLERDRRTQSVLAQRQAVEDLRRQIEIRQTDAADLQAQARSIPAQLAIAASQTRSARSALEQGLDEIDTQGRLIVRAPVDGRITAINGQVGGAMVQGASLVTIAPTNSPLRAELFIPTRAAGFVAEGQSVRLMVDAFPYQRFGMLAGTISRIHRSALPTQGADGVAQPAYRTWVRIPHPSVSAYGEERALRPGMQVTADIVTARQTLLQFLFDPLVSARGRTQG